MAFNAQPAPSAGEEVCPTKGTAALCKRDHQAMYEQSYGHDFDSSRQTVLKPEQNRWQSSLVRESSEAMMPGLVNEQPVSLTFGVEVRVWIIMIKLFPFCHSSNPKLTCHTLDTFAQMSSLLHKRQEGLWQPGGQEPWN